MRRTALLLTIVILAGLSAAWPAEAAPVPKVAICHKPGTPAERTIHVALPAVPAHAGHGDYLGECGAGPGGTEPGGTEPGGGGPVDACSAINAGSFADLLFQGTEVVTVVLDYATPTGHVAWFEVCGAGECALIMPRVNWQAHDEFGFPWRAGSLWAEGPITIALDVRPAPVTMTITCGQG